MSLDYLEEDYDDYASSELIEEFLGLEDKEGYVN